MRWMTLDVDDDDVKDGVNVFLSYFVVFNFQEFSRHLALENERLQRTEWLKLNFF